MDSKKHIPVPKHTPAFICADWCGNKAVATPKFCQREATLRAIGARTADIFQSMQSFCVNLNSYLNATEHSARSIRHYLPAGDERCPSM